MVRSKTKKKGGKVSYYNIASDPSGYRGKKKVNRRNKSAGQSLGKDVGKALSTGVGVAEDMGSLGMNVGKTAVKNVEDVGKEGIRFGKRSMNVGKKILTMKKKKSKKKGKSTKGKSTKGKSTKGKSKKNSYRSYLSKRLKQVKKAHPSWPQSKVFKEAVKGWKSSK